ncbi:hypothetical protein D3C75_410260 [compost metagenome]
MEKIDILCIGTPRVNGDAVGPMVGTMLLKRGVAGDVNIIGTLEKPVIKTNYIERLKELREDAYLIVVDAAVAPRGPVPSYMLRVGQMIPGASRDTTHNPIGDIVIKCFTAREFNELLTFPAEQLNQMAFEITTTLIDLTCNNKIKEYIEENK